MQISSWNIVIVKWSEIEIKKWLETRPKSQNTARNGVLFLFFYINSKFEQTYGLEDNSVSAPNSHEQIKQYTCMFWRLSMSYLIVCCNTHGIGRSVSSVHWIEQSLSGAHPPITRDRVSIGWLKVMVGWMIHGTSRCKIHMCSIHKHIVINSSN